MATWIESNISTSLCATFDRIGRSSNGRLWPRAGGSGCTKIYGGHSFEKYSFADKNSVVVDLRRMNDVKQSGMIVVLGPGWALIGPAAIEIWNSGKVSSLRDHARQSDFQDLRLT